MNLTMIYIINNLSYIEFKKMNYICLINVYSILHVFSTFNKHNTLKSSQICCVCYCMFGSKFTLCLL